MIQDIYPHKLINSFRNRDIKIGDILMFFDGEGRIYANVDDGLKFPVCKDPSDSEAIFLFEVDDRNYFLSKKTAQEMEGFSYYTVRQLRDLAAGAELFAAFTAYHLWKWYDDNRFCGKCAGALIPDTKERAMRCPECGNIIYPRINPAVIVGVKKGDCLLITRYRRGYAHNALVAGFTEIGETLEETVAREVMEETGVKVTNIRYYRSQPWGMAQAMLVGFFCDADGDGNIRMDENELKYAEWVKREEIELQPNDLSLTNDMMKAFKNNTIV